MEFQEMLEKMVKDIIRKEQANLTREETKQIVKELLPDLEEIVAKKVKEHFVILADAIKQKFNPEEETMDAKDP